MKIEHTLTEIDGALDELDLLMGECDDHRQLEMFTLLYAKAYCIKLRLLSKQTGAPE